jgi:hypothetical protein
MKYGYLLPIGNCSIFFSFERKILWVAWRSGVSLLNYKIFIEGHYNKSLMKRASESPQRIPVSLEGPLTGLSPLPSSKEE